MHLVEGIVNDAGESIKHQSKTSELVKGSEIHPVHKEEMD